MKKLTIGELDDNFTGETIDPREGFRPVRETKVEVEGLCPDRWQRVPQAVLEEINRPALSHLAHCTSGGVLRFRAQEFALKLHLGNPELVMPHMALTGSSGVDVVVEGQYRGTFQLPYGADWVEGEMKLERVSEIMVYLPLYNSVADLLIWGDIAPPTSRDGKAPLVFYGSSITQGGCASRPSNSYTAMVGRHLDYPCRNLGFSGNAKGDMALAEYISTLEMSCFIYDYDHNAPSATFLAQTHQPFLEHILKAQPSLPVLVLSKPDLHPWKPELEEEKRRDIIQETVANLSQYSVTFCDGGRFFQGNDCCTVDTIHPNDLGFWKISEEVKGIIWDIIV